jgi:hypothetical protein
VAKGNSDLPLLVILVGSLADGFVRQAKIILERLGVEFVLSGNIYSAIGNLAAIDNQNVLIVGRFSMLSKEKGRFFHLARVKGYRCCCLVDRDLLRRQKFILKAIESGAYFIDKAAGIEEVLMKLLTGDKISSSADIEKRKTSGFHKDEFLTTKAELDALLEVESDEKL